MTPGEALLLARRVARRVTRDTPIASAEDYESAAALAILACESSDPALHWTVARRAIVDEYRRVHGRKGSARLAATTERIGDIPDVMPEELVAARTLIDRYPSRLTERERAVVSLLAEGLSTAEAALVLGIGYETVKTHAWKAQRRVGARTRPHLVALALTLGEIDPPPVKLAPE